MKNEPLGPGNPINKPPNDSDLGFTSESRPYKRSYVNFSLPMRDIDKWAFSKKCLYASYPRAILPTKHPVASRFSYQLDRVHERAFCKRIRWNSLQGLKDLRTFLFALPSMSTRFHITIPTIYHLPWNCQIKY